jgi:hypothetical protein
MPMLKSRDRVSSFGTQSMIRSVEGYSIESCAQHSTGALCFIVTGASSDHFGSGFISVNADNGDT